MVYQSLTGTDTFMSFIYSNNHDVRVTGTNDTLELANSTGDTVIDHGTGLGLTLLWNFSATVRDFQFDPAGHVTMIEGYGQHVMPALTPDGHGGTMLSMGFNHLDFVGDKTLSAANISIVTGGH